MAKNIIETIDERIKSNISEKDIIDYHQRLTSNGVYDPNDPTDISIIPRVISKKEHQKLTDICKDITSVGFNLLMDYIDNPDLVPRSFTNDFIKTLPLNQRFLSGVARYDLLKQGEDFKLIEMNFVNAMNIELSVESPRVYLEMFPELKSDFQVFSPYDGVKKLFLGKNITNVLSINENPTLTATRYMINSLKPLNAVNTFESLGDYERISIDDLVEYNGESFAGIYPRYLSGTLGKDDPLVKYESLVRGLLSSDAFVIDHWITMLLEEKDLRFLTRKDSRIARYLPRTFEPSELPNKKDFSEIVLKEKDLHGGRGVIVAPDSIDNSNAILQERLYPNKYPVRSILGRTGNAICDTGVYVCYEFDTQEKTLTGFEVVGYLSRYSLDRELVNITLGGGINPVLVEK